MHQLEIYIEQNCFGCEYAKALASEAQELFPQLQVRILDLTRPNIRKPESVFAVPTYILDNSIIWLGNPEKGDFLDKLRDSLMW
jgi:hypothetical protein